MTVPWVIFWGIACLTVFLIGRFAWRDSKRAIDRARDLDGRLLNAEHERNVAHVFLAQVRRCAEATVSGDEHPYRVDPVRLVEALAEVQKIANSGLRMGSREVGCFRRLEDAARFAQTRGPESYPYLSPLRLWDGDCYHVVYSVAPEEPVWSVQDCNGCIHYESGFDNPTIPCPLFNRAKVCPEWRWDAMAGPEPTEMPPPPMKVRR